jgi:hypothetical protein
LGKPIVADMFFNICGNEDNDIIYILDKLLKLSKPTVDHTRLNDGTAV